MGVYKISLKNWEFGNLLHICSSGNRHLCFDYYANFKFLAGYFQKASQGLVKAFIRQKVKSLLDAFVKPV